MISLFSLVGERIVLVKQPFTKQQLLKQLVQQIGQAVSGLDPTFILEQIVQREQAMSTTLDTGINIPHVRVEGLDRIMAALAVLPRPLLDTNGKQIKAMFLFLSPARPEFFQQHLQVLATLAETFTADFLMQLTAATHEQQIAHLLAQNEILEK